MAEIKYTQKQMFEEVIKIASGKPTSIPMDKIIEFVEKKLEQLDKKSGATSSKKNDEYRAIMDMVVAVLCNADKPMRCGDIVKAVNVANGTDFSSSKINAMLRKLLPPDEKNPDGTGEVVRTTEKKEAYFSLA